MSEVQIEHLADQPPGALIEPESNFSVQSRFKPSTATSQHIKLPFKAITTQTFISKYINNGSCHVNPANVNEIINSNIERESNLLKTIDEINVT